MAESIVAGNRVEAEVADGVWMPGRVVYTERGMGGARFALVQFDEWNDRYGHALYTQVSLVRKLRPEEGSR